MKDRSYQDVKSQRQSTKHRLIEAFGGKCGICGYNRCVSSLEFHHIDPTEKEFSFASKCRAQNKIATEAIKCVMVCSNCHREIHDGIIEIPNDIQRFNEAFIDYRTTKYNNECPVCGLLKPRVQITCSKKCAGIYRHKIDQDGYNLKELYNELGSFVAVANYIGCVSDVSVKKRMVLLNLL